MGSMRHAPRLLALVLALAVAASACSSAQVNVGAGVAAAPASGSTVSGGSVSVHAHGGSGLATVLIAMFLLAGVANDLKEERPFPSPSALIPANTPPVPALARERRVSEQDCTRPIDWTAGNLRCK